MKIANRIVGLGLLAMAQLVSAQSHPQTQTPQLAIGENTRLTAGGLFTFGYTGGYGDVIPSDHSLTFGMDGRLSGYYYNPNFISFSATPYIDQSRANSSYQSLTGASGINTSVNFFAGSHFPGAVNYHFDRNTSGTFGLSGQPNFTAVGKDQGFGVSWSALVPNLPTLSVGYSQGSGKGTIYGTDEETNSNSKLFNVHSGYDILGFRLTAYYDHNQLDAKYPTFLSGQQSSIQDSNGDDVGFGAQHNLPLNGQVFVNFNRMTADTSYLTDGGQASNRSNYTDDIVNTGASFHPTRRLTLDVNANYTSNLNGFLAETANGSGTVEPTLNFGSGAHSSTFGGGAAYQLTSYLAASSQFTYYDQEYFGKTYTGMYASGTLEYGKRLWDMFTFSGSVVDSDNGQGTNSLGFVGNVNFFHRIKGWRVTGLFSYAQNVQSVLVTYTSSYYSYSANLHRRLSTGIQWTAAFNGTHSGLTNYQGTSSRSEGYSTSLGWRKMDVTANYTRSKGLSLLGAGGLLPVSVTPGLTNSIIFGGSSYGGGISITPVRRLVFAGSYNRGISNTEGDTTSHNNTVIYNAQMHYHLRRIGLEAGYTRFTQGISAVGLPANTTSYFVGISRWFDFF